MNDVAAWRENDVRCRAAIFTHKLERTARVWLVGIDAPHHAAVDGWEILSEPRSEREHPLPRRLCGQRCDCGWRGQGDGRLGQCRRQPRCRGGTGRWRETDRRTGWGRRDRNIGRRNRRRRIAYELGSGGMCGQHHKQQRTRPRRCAATHGMKVIGPRITHGCPAAESEGCHAVVFHRKRGKFKPDNGLDGPVERPAMRLTPSMAA